MVCKRFDLAWISVNDFEAAKKFFIDTMGMKVSSEAPEYSWAELAAPDGGATLGLAKADPNNPASCSGANAVVTFTVDDIEKSRAELEKKGVNLIGEIMEVPGHVKLQLFTDPDQNTFQLVQLLAENK